MQALMAEIKKPLIADIVVLLQACMAGQLWLLDVYVKQAFMAETTKPHWLMIAKSNK